MPEILTSTFVLAVQDLEASKRFYMEKLGFAEDFKVDGWARIPGPRPSSCCGATME